MKSYDESVYKLPSSWRLRVQFGLAGKVVRWEWWLRPEGLSRPRAITGLQQVRIWSQVCQADGHRNNCISILFKWHLSVGCACRSHELNKRVVVVAIIIIIIIIIFLIFTFMRGAYNYTPETNHVFMVYSVAAVLYLQSVIHVMLFGMLNMFRTFTLSLPSVRKMPDFCSSLISCCSGILLRYCLSDFKMVPVAPIIITFPYYYYYYYTIWMSLVTGLFFLVLLWTSSDPHRSRFKLHTAVLSVLCVMFQV